MRLFLNIVGFAAFAYALYFSFIEVEGVLSNVVMALFGLGMFVMATSYQSTPIGEIKINVPMDDADKALNK